MMINTSMFNLHSKYIVAENRSQKSTHNLPNIQ